MFLILCIMFLSGCTSVGSNAYEQQLQNWVGMSQEALYYSWGEPDNEIYPSPGVKVVTYVKNFDGLLDGETEPYANQINYSAIDAGYGSESGGDYYCRTTFTIENNEVVDYSFNGDDCVAGN